MSIYITGDTHGDFKDIRMYPWHRFYTLKDLTKDDVLIVAGDWGFDWNEEYHKTYMSLPHPFTIAFIRGNHDNVDVLNFLPKTEKWGDVVGDFGNNTYWLLDGHMYTIEGKKFFCFGGAASIDKDWRIIEEQKNHEERTLWWPEEVPSDGIFEVAKRTLAENNYTFDYFITHTCRPGLKGIVLNSYKADFHDDTEDMIASLEDSIRDNNGSYRAHFFGHFHDNKSWQTEHCLYDNVVNITEGYVITPFTNTRNTFYEDESERAFW